MARTNIRPFAEIRFTQNDGAGRAQLLHDERVRGRFRSDQRQRSSRRLHAVQRRNVVLDQNRNSVQRPARPFFFPLLVQRLRNFQRVRIRFNDAVDRRSAIVDRRDALEIFQRDGLRVVLPGFHSPLQFANRNLVQLKRWNIRSLCGSTYRSRVSARRPERRLQDRTSRSRHAAQQTGLQESPPSGNCNFAFSVRSLRGFRGPETRSRSFLFRLFFHFLVPRPLALKRRAQIVRQTPFRALLNLVSKGFIPRNSPKKEFSLWPRLRYNSSHAESPVVGLPCC